MKKEVDFLIRLLTLEDLEAALTLSSTAGWNQQLGDWRMLLTLAPGGSFAAISEGRIVGTSIGIDYDSFAWIAMMLVDPAYRGRGLGGRLLEAALDSVPPDRPIRLDSTPMGRPMYQRYGFEDETTLTRHVADASSRHAGPAAGSQNGLRDVRPLTAVDLPIVTEQDGRIFGGNRRAVLEWARERTPHYARVVQNEARPVHYCFGREGRLFDQIGPVVATDDEAARVLVNAALPGAGGRAVVLDVFDSESTFTEWLHASGFRVERPLFRMRRPAAERQAETVNRKPFGLREFAIFGPEFG